MVLADAVGPAVTRKQPVCHFMTGFTVETTRGAAAKIAGYRGHLYPRPTVDATELARQASSVADLMDTRNLHTRAGSTNRRMESICERMLSPARGVAS